MNTTTLGEIIVFITLDTREKYSLEDLHKKIKLAIQKNAQTKGILNIDKYNFQIRKKDAIYIAINEQNEFQLVYLRKELFVWTVRMKFDLKGMSFDLPQTEKIHNVLIDLFRSTLIISRYNIEDFFEVKINDQNNMSFKIEEYNIAFDFFLEDKNREKVVEGFNTLGQSTFVNEITIESIKFS
ncbi:hypothetical protein [Cohnella sp. WQ 127256]|uniref:hypothetical protein n=1 Tax=Cohnella sp. WQ 127256 TaxID=2938790 RepID=UPI002118E1DA|nr:hypothetical protein [Cohnella sp. WQ 127256]